MIDCLQGKQLYAVSMVSVSTGHNYCKAISVSTLCQVFLCNVYTQEYTKAYKAIQDIVYMYSFTYTYKA